MNPATTWIQHWNLRTAANVEIYGRTNVTGAYIFFAALYFVQSAGDPTSGLIAQPVRSLLRSWGESPASLGALMALLAVPWTIKPAFGLLSDFVPLFGSRRRNYLLLANSVAAASLLLLAFNPLAQQLEVPVKEE